MTSTAEPLWLHLHLPLLALEAQHFNHVTPALLKDGSGKVVLLANQTAQSLGVEQGQSVLTALSLAPSCSVYAQQGAVDDLLSPLAMMAYQYSGSVVVVPPNGLSLELGSMLRYFGGLTPLLAQLEQTINVQGYTAIWATAHTPLAAKLLTHSGQAQVGQSKEDSKQLLQKCHVALLPIKPKDVLRMEGMGLHHFADLEGLPRKEVQSRFGQHVCTFLGRAFGRAYDPQQTFQPPEHFAQTLMFNGDVNSTQMLRFPINRLLVAMQGYLYQRHYVAELIHLRLLMSETSSVLEVGCHGGSQLAEQWLSLCMLRLEPLVLRESLRGIAIEAVDIKALTQQTVSLFEESTATDPKVVLSQLQARLGQEAVSCLSVQDDHRPEKAWCYREYSELTTQDKVQLSAPQNHSPYRPCWLLEQPKLLSKVVAPTYIEILSGPERIVSGWWQPEEKVQRDYYLGRWPDSRVGWLFKDQREHWYLHGWFA